MQRDFFKIFVNMIRKTSYEKIFNKENAYKYAHHGWEHVVFSQGALYHFISEPNNKIILEDSLSINHLPMCEFPGDVFPSVLSNLSGIPFCEVDFLSYLPDFEKFIKKELFHIHYIYKKNEYNLFINLARKIINKKFNKDLK